MVNLELIDYIRNLKTHQITDDVIRTNLRNAGWSNGDIEAALSSSPDIQVPHPSNSIGRPEMWDAFQHILLFISLYVMTTAIAMIGHLFIDKWFPGVSLNQTSNYLAGFQTTVLRGYLAALIVAYPLFSLFFLRITKQTQINPSIRNLKSRKSLIYFTLVITFIIVISSIISLVFGLLNGNVTINFLLHFLVTTVISGIIFSYYLLQIKEDQKING